MEFKTAINVMGEVFNLHVFVDPPEDTLASHAFWWDGGAIATRDKGHSEQAAIIIVNAALDVASSKYPGSEYSRIAVDVIED